MRWGHVWRIGYLCCRFRHAGAQQAELAAESLHLLGECQHGLILLHRMALQMGVALFQSQQSFRFAHAGRMRIAGRSANPSVRRN